MIVKIFLYILIFSLVGIEEYYWGIFQDISMLFIPVILFVIYFSMLYLEIKKISTTDKPYRFATKTGFLFSFCIGIIWACIMSFSAGFHYPLPKTIIEISWMIFNWGVIGLIFGFMGKKLSGFFYNHQRKLG